MGIGVTKVLSTMPLFVFHTNAFVDDAGFLILELINVIRVGLARLLLNLTECGKVQLFNSVAKNS